MPPPNTREPFRCLLCDYWIILFSLLLTLGVAVWYLEGKVPIIPTVPTSPTLPVIPTSVIAENSLATSTPNPTATPTLTSTPAENLTVTPTTPPKPEFILAFIPVNWRSGRAQFEADARRHADFFQTISGIGNYFDVKVILLEESLDGVSLSERDILDQVIEFGLAHIPADRYIGITDGDLSPEGETLISGWAYGPDSLGIIGEAQLSEITAHELGHTFGLCDEYNYYYWSQQNEEFPDGCPNPYPDDCSRDLTEAVVCMGNKTDDGRFSIMGPGGLPGDYGYNQQSYDYLQEVFSSLSNQGNQ